MEKCLNLIFLSFNSQRFPLFIEKQPTEAHGSTLGATRRKLFEYAKYITSTAKQDEPSSTEQIVKLEEPSSTERAQEEQITLATSKSWLSGISPNEFKADEVVSPDQKQEFEVDGGGATTAEQLYDEIPSGTESSQSEAPSEDISNRIDEDQAQQQPTGVQSDIDAAIESAFDTINADLTLQQPQRPDAQWPQHALNANLLRGIEERLGQHIRPLQVTKYNL